MFRLFSCVLLAISAGFAQPKAGLGAPPTALRPAEFVYEAPEQELLSKQASGDLREVLLRYSSDLANLNRLYDAPMSARREKALREFYAVWNAALDRIPFEALNQDGKVDYILFRNRIRDDLRALDLAAARKREMAAAAPFHEQIVALWEARQRTDPIDPRKVAGEIAQLGTAVQELNRKAGGLQMKKTAANRAAAHVAELRGVLRRWHDFYSSYDPAFTWWMSQPYQKASAALETYAATLRERVAGVRRDDKDTIVGDPIGREALLADLESEFIPYTPEQLITIANREFAWCETEMKKASRELGYGDDWKRALEYVKNLYVSPGDQPDLVRNLALEAIDYVTKNDLVTVPQLARNGWRMEMMSAEQQRLAPFFLGGEVIRVSYPLSNMTHEEKMMSMRGNNVHFSRATVHHELIPGHWLQRYMNERFRPYRAPFRTPFWGEGWALYWEFLLWDRGFPVTPENKIGMLFWRMHRCARIIFSLSFHLEKMTPAEAVDFLVEKVGHERENAAAEVRRSFEGAYGPLYQIAYMIGALEFRALKRELVETGRMKLKEFHDAILKLNSMPVELVRASLTNQPLTREFKTGWRFYGEIP